MTSPAEETAFGAEGYLAWEDQQAEKQEYVRGEVLAMVGARRERFENVVRGASQTGSEH